MTTTKIVVRTTQQQDESKMGKTNLSLKLCKIALVLYFISFNVSLLVAQQEFHTTTVPGPAAASTLQETPPPTTTTTLTTTGDEINTSTVPSPADSLGSINPEETTTFIVNLDENSSTEAIGDSLGSEAGILGKSISTSDSDFNSNSDKGGKLMTISQDGSATTTTSPDTMETTSETTIATGTATSDPNHDDSSTARSKPRAKNLARINMTNIDEIYNNAHRSEEEVVDSWLKMGKRLKKAIGNIIGSMVPVALNMTQEARISNDCSGAMLKWVLSMNHLKTWALKMLDASGKPVAGLMEGSMTMFGNYRQCLGIRAPDDDEIEFAGEFREYFRGKYCIIQAKPWLPKKERFYGLNSKIKSLMENSEENPWYDRNVFDEVNEWLLAFNYINIRMDLCIPSLCSREDIQSVINYLLRGIDFKARVLRCEMDSPEGGFTSFIESGSTELADALTASASLDPNSKSKTTWELFSQLGWLLVPIISIIVVLLASCLSMAINRDEEQQLLTTSSGKTTSDNDTITTSLGDSIDNNDSLRNYVNSTNMGRKFKQTIMKLSLKKSLSNHTNVDYDQLADEKPLALYGIRFILVSWILMVEFAINLKFEYLRELLPLKDLIFWWPLQIFINSTLQYDSVILLTAFTMSYKNCLNFSTSSKSLGKFVLDKYIRLMPSIMVTVAFTILLPLLYRGPVWNDYVTKQSAVCQSTGWLNMLFLQNYLPYKEICLPHTWLLCVEFQLILLMAPIIYYLNKSYNDNRKETPPTNASVGNGASKVPSTNDSSRPLFWLKTMPGLFLLACIAMGTSYSFYNVYMKDLPPSFLYTMPDPDTKAIYFGEHFMRLWTHLTVFAIGILAGIECRRMTRNIYIKHNSRGVVNGGSGGYKKANLLINNYHNSVNNNNNTTNNKDGNGLRKYYQQNSSSTSTTSLPIISLSGSESLKSMNNNQFVNDNKTNKSTGSDVSININRNSIENIDKIIIGSKHHTGTDIEGLSINTTTTTTTTNSVGKRICSFLLNSFGCLIAFTVMGTIIFLSYDWMYELPKPLIAALYDSGSRLLWSLAFIWLLYLACVPNKSDKSFSFISNMLGHPAMVCLGKLSFLIYLIHPIVHITVLAIQEQPIYSSWLMLFHILIGNMTITIALALFISLFVEIPCRNLFRRNETSLLLTPTTPTCNSCHQSLSSILH